MIVFLLRLSALGRWVKINSVGDGDLPYGFVTVWVQTKNNSVTNCIPKKEVIFSWKEEGMKQGEEVICIVGNGIQTFQKDKQNRRKV